MAYSADGFQDNVNENIFEGLFDCQGSDPYLNKNYTGTVVVHQQNSVYRLEMTYDTGENYVGTGAQYNPTLMFVAFQDLKNAHRVGLEQYTLSDDKNTMQGYWVYLKDDKLGKEVCHRRVSAKS